jgi:long-subunit acyl-CoA synthetase (AMP-forming)
LYNQVYASVTTEDPKGMIITNRAIIAGISTTDVTLSRRQIMWQGSIILFNFIITTTTTTTTKSSSPKQVILLIAILVIFLDYGQNSSLIGGWQPDGLMKIIDRKNIFKLSQGEYVAVEVLESAYI